MEFSSSSVGFFQALFLLFSEHFILFVYFVSFFFVINVISNQPDSKIAPASVLFFINDLINYEL